MAQQASQDAVFGLHIDLTATSEPCADGTLGLTLRSDLPFHRKPDSDNNLMKKAESAL